MIFLSKPYPYLYTLKRNLIVAASVGILSMYLNHIRLNDNFFTDNILISPTLISLLTGILVAFSIILVFHIIPLIFISDNKRDNWSLGNELLLSLGVFMAIFISNYSLFVVVTKDASELLSIAFFLKILTYIITTGTVILSIVLWVNYTIILKRNLKNVQKLNLQLDNSTVETVQDNSFSKDKVIIPTVIKNEVIEFVVDDLVCIKSNGNYIEVFLKINNEIKMQLFRATIQELDEKLLEWDFIIKTHRSFIVNTHYITKAEGNARNYQLYLLGIKESIPVARGRFKEFNTFFNKT